MRKVDDGEEKKKKKKKEKKKIMTFIVATNVIASWLPERQPTGTPNARANTMNQGTLQDLHGTLKGAQMESAGVIWWDPFDSNWLF